MYTLIIVEDEADIREGLVELIPWAEIGFEVAAPFENGRDALDWLQSHRADAVIADIMMENGSGLDVAEWLSRQHRSEMMVFYSAFQDFRYAQLGMQYGVRRYITKDMGYHELLNAFRDVRQDLDSTYHPPGSPAAAREDDALNALMRYLQRNYRTATLNSAAGVAHMNPSYLSTYIKKHLNENFKTILTRIRMEKAHELMADPTLSLSRIRDMVGYGDERTFNRAFRQQYGVLPGEYRKTLGGTVGK